jgi:hypothetical protein
MFDKLSRSFALLRASLAVLRADKELLVFPLCSAIASLLVVASFALPLFASGAFERIGAGESPDAVTVVIAFLFYLTQYFVIFFFNSALVGAAMIRLKGGDPTVSDGFRIASSRVGSILGYAAIAATVGLILRVIEERAGFVGRWIAGLIGVAFTVATFLTVPILVSRGIGPVDAVKESAVLLKKTWGENVAGNVGLGLAFMLAYFLAVAGMLALFFLAASTGNVVLVGSVIAIGIVAFIGIALMQSALQGIYSAALYRYASDGSVGGPFANDLLQSAFRPKK